MGYRRFTDEDGVAWDVRDVSSGEWEFAPVDPRRPPVRVAAPGYQKDPFELSAEELQRLLDHGHPGSGGASPWHPRKPSPFKD